MQLGGLGPRGLGHPGLAAHVRGGPGGRRGAALAAPHARRGRTATQKFPPPVTSGAASGSRGGLQAPRGWSPRAWICPRITKEAGAPRPGAAVQLEWWPELESFLDIQGQCSPEGGSVSLGSSPLNFHIKISQAINAGY